MRISSIITNVTKAEGTKYLYFYTVRASKDCTGVATFSGGKFTSLTGDAKFWVENDRSLVKKIFGTDATDEEVYNDLVGWSNGDTFTATYPR